MFYSKECIENAFDVLCSLLTSDYRRAETNYESIKDKLGKPRWKFDQKIVTQEQIDDAKAKLDAETAKVPVAAQVKEKFGGLRFYVHDSTDTHYNYISFAENMSYRTCEDCGAVGKTYTDGWYTTLCDIHAVMDGRTEHEDEGNE